MGSKPIKVLLIEDNPDDTRQIQEMLAGARGSLFNLECADRLSEVLGHLVSGGINVILLDLSLPDSQGIESFNTLYAQAPSIPVVVLTASHEEKLAIKAVQAGAQDHLVKGQIDGNQLVRSIRYAIERQKRLLAELDRYLRSIVESQIRFRDMIQKDADGIVIVDRDGMVQFVNPAAEALLGRRAEELLGEMFGFPVVVEEATEIDIVHRDGKWGMAEMRVVETKWEGQAARLISMRDITKRKQAERELRIKDNAIASTVDAIAIADFDGVLTYVNPAFLAMWGYDNDGEVLGRPITEFLNADEETQAIIEGLYEQGSWQGELTHAKKDGSEFNTQLSISQVTDNDDRCIAVMASFIDLTERKKAEQAQKRLSQQLQQKVSELEAFSYGIAHDLKSPLLSIEGLSRLLRDDIKNQKTEQVQEDIRLLESGVRRMQQFLNRTLEYSRAGYAVKPARNVSFGKLAKEVVAEFSEQMRSIGATVSLAKEFPKVYIDRMRIKEVLTNLIQNSIDYRDKNVPLKIEIGYRLSKREDVFFVRDNGTGIDTSDMEKVFALFYRGTADGEGSGAGLAIVKRIIEAHGGRVWVQYQTEKGTTICFALPKQRNTKHGG